MADQKNANRKVYRVKKDISVPLITHAVQYADGSYGYETEGVNLPAGSHLTIGRIAQPLRQRIEDGDKDDFFEEVDEVPEEVVNPRFGTFVPEHETEAQYLKSVGHTVVPREQVLDAMSAGADDAREAQENARDDGSDFRPTGDEDSSNVEIPAGTEKPPGFPIKDASKQKRQRPSSSRKKSEDS